MGLFAWLFGRSKKAPPSAPVAPSRPTPGTPAPAALESMSYAELRRLDDAAVAEFATANAEALVARNAGDTARAARLLEQYRVAFARHLQLDAAARVAWNREHGVR